MPKRPHEPHPAPPKPPKADGRKQKRDAELEEFRGLMQVPSTFEEGFNLTALFGALFIGLIMVPGALYMGLLAGEANIGPAAQWVTVILFIEAARRAQRQIKRAEIFILFFMAGTAMSMPFSGLLWNQFYMRSDAAIASGIAEQLPAFFAPQPDSASYAARTFLHWDWAPAMGLIVFTAIFGQLSNMVLGYGLFRLTSDIEKLPFPMAPIGAQGILALAEDIGQGQGQTDAPPPDPSGGKPKSKRKRQPEDYPLGAHAPASAGAAGSSWRWRMFSIGGAIGLVFGFLYLGVPTLTGIILDEPLKIFPIPWVDWSEKTKDYLPAVATGLSWDLGNVIVGMVLPFWAMVGSFIGLLVTMILNPTLRIFGLLPSWVPGDSTVETVFKNNVDFYFSFQIGVSLAVALVGFWEVFKTVREKRRERAEQTAVLRSTTESLGPPPGRGDIAPWLIAVCYVVVTCTYIAVSGFLVNWHPGVMIVLCFFGFLYTPVISYVTARLEGIAGQVVEIPMIREASLILSGYPGVAVWFLPIPAANYGTMTMFYRSAELTGTKFTSVWKSQVVLYPIILISSILFASFIWGLAEVPSAVYPYAATMWELEANNRSIIYSSTLGDYSIFERAFSWEKLGWGSVFGLGLFTVMGGLQAPVFLIYGVVRGLGQSLPHMIIPQMFGALVGRYYFQKRFGDRWRQYIPVIAAGFACGQGLITIACVGVTFLSKAAVQLPY